MSMEIMIENEVRAKLPGISLGVIEYKSCEIGETPKMIKGRISLFLSHLRLEYGTDKLTQIHGIKEWRKGFKSLSMDPSKYRPSSEALLRRGLQEKPMYWVNSAVDINNYFSMKHGMPYGIYQADKIEGNVVLRMGRQGESYMGLNGRVSSMEGKLLLADDQSPFGSPIVDSVRTSITEDAKHILQIVFIHPELPEMSIPSILDETASLFLHINGGNTIRNEIIK